MQMFRLLAQRKHRRCYFTQYTINTSMVQHRQLCNGHYFKRDTDAFLSAVHEFVSIHCIGEDFLFELCSLTVMTCSIP